MDYRIVDLPERAIVGPRIHTANDAPDCTSAIGGLWQRFMEEGMGTSLPGVRQDPYACFALYYEYGPTDNSYDLLVGCETAEAATGANSGCVIPAGRYAKFEIRGGDCVNSVIAVWNEIWNDAELTAKRTFTVDFEAYLPGDDQSCADIDIFVGLV